MSNPIDKTYVADQYQDASKLNARIALHRRFSASNIDWQTWVFDQFDLADDAVILELGCGPGRLWAQNGNRVPASWSITLSDQSPGMLQQARQNLATYRHAFKFAHIDAQTIPFDEGSFDAVIANHMLYHVPDRQKTYAEVRRVLKPRGQFYAAANSANTMRQLQELESELGITGGVKDFYSGAGFTLESGAVELSAWFTNVTLRTLEDNLLVTEVEPLIDYEQSVVGGSGMPTEATGQLRKRVEAEIVQHGAFRIDKATGMFVARNSE